MNRIECERCSWYSDHPSGTVLRSRLRRHHAAVHPPPPKSLKPRTDFVLWKGNHS